jgi:transposase
VRIGISYCVVQRGEVFGRRHEAHPSFLSNATKHLQCMRIEAAKWAPRNSPALALVYDREKQKGNANRATLAVARKLVAYLLAVDRSQRDSLVIENQDRTAA